MRKDEAEKIIEILLECDGGCEYCVSSLLSLFRDKFPEYRSLTEIAFKNKFGKKLEDFLNQQHEENKERR